MIYWKTCECVELVGRSAERTPGHAYCGHDVRQCSSKQGFQGLESRIQNPMVHSPKGPCIHMSIP